MLEDFPFVSLGVPQRYCEEPRGKWVGNWRAIARPANDDELEALLKFANENAVPIVPYGGGTGLVGGQMFAEPSGAICLSMEKFDQIEIEEDTALVGAGVILDQLHDALEGTGFYFPVSLASSGSAQIGGLIATNAGGVNVVRFGNMGEQVLGLRAHLADGRVVDRTHNLRKDNTGYQLDRMMIGAEGTLGVISKARLKLVRVDAQLSTCLAQVRSPEAALEILGILKRGEAPIHAFELISQTSWRIREEAEFAPTPIGAPEWSVLIELASGVEQFESVVGRFDDAVVAASLAQRKDIWHLRETIPLANRKIGAIASHDIALPMDRTPKFIEVMALKLQDMDDVRINAFGHMGDGNLHYNLFPTHGRARESYDAQALSLMVYRTVVEMGGSISAEHGIGRAKGALMRELGQSEKLDVMKDIKAALDPNGIMNPGVFGFGSDDLKAK